MWEKLRIHYAFKHDLSKPGRDLENVKIGSVYVSRLTIQPNVVTGNIYHKHTNVVLYVASGRVRFKFVQIKTKEEKEFVLDPGGGLVYVPPFTAIADKNISKSVSVVIYLSNKPFRHGDDHKYKIY